MANKLYEENSIRAIAETTRLFSNYSRTYTVGQMAQGVRDACQDQYERGLDSGFTEGELSGVTKVKTEEARDESHITAPTNDTENDYLPVTVQSGYYNETVVKNFDLTNLLDARYEAGYNDGLADGGGGTDPLLEEMLIVTDEEYEDEGKQFYSVYKWLGMYHSNFSSFPWMLELENEHPTLWLHVYVQVNGKYYLGYDEETGELFYERATHSYVLTVGPDYGVNSIEEDEMEVTGFYIDGVRWSTDGV